MRARRRWLGTASAWLLAALALLTGCGQPLPTPTAGPAARPVNENRAPGRLLFARGGNIWLWADGQETQLTQDGGRSQPRWSPDGSQVLWVQRGDSYADLWLADAQGGAARPLTANKSVRFPVDSREYVLNSFQLTGPSWARLADGSDRLVFSTDQGGGGLALWLLNGLGGKPQQVFATRDLPGHIEGAALSPDGNRLVFTYDTANPDTNARTTQLYVADLTTGSYRALTDTPEGAYDAVWSPDAAWIVYAARRKGRAGSDLWAIRPDGTENHRLTDGGSDRGPAFSPDGNQLAFVRQSGGGYGLYYVDLAAPNGSLTATKAQPIGSYGDVDPASGVSWAR